MTLTLDTDAPPHLYKPSWDEINDWFDANPDIYQVFVDNCRLWQARTGETRWAVGAAWERMRWVLKVRADSTDGYGLNDHLRPYMVRLAVHQEPDLAGMFEQRSADADGWIRWRNTGCKYRQSVVIIETGDTPTANPTPDCE